jgi:hypothetical protein
MIAPASAATALLDSRAEAAVRVPGRGEIRLFDFRPDSARGWKIRKAALYLHVDSGTAPATLPVSTVTVRWREEAPDKARHFVFGEGNSLHGRYRVEVLPEGWIRVEIPPALIESHTAEKSFGFAIEEGKRRFSGRKPVDHQPYMMVEGDPPE